MGEGISEGSVWPNVTQRRAAVTRRRPNGGESWRIRWPNGGESWRIGWDGSFVTERGWRGYGSLISGTEAWFSCYSTDARGMCSWDGNLPIYHSIF